MKIGIDAKRAYCNQTGLGVYSRNLLKGFADFSSQKNEFHLYTPKDNGCFQDNLSTNFHKKLAQHSFKSYWRSQAIIKDLQEDKIAVFHGLSNELPFSLKNSSIKKVVTIHDLLFLRFPKNYPFIDRKIYTQKVKSACQMADKIIATSEATKRDLIDFLAVPSEKIEVVYQCCDTTYYETVSLEKKATIQAKYQLPEEFILSVGTLEERKNQVKIVEAMASLPKEDQLPIVLVGKGKNYAQKVKQASKDLNVEVIFLENVNFEDLPAIYQLAKLFVYPALFEGFGIPVLEAMASKVPVITSQETSMAEIIQDENALINPTAKNELATKMKAFLQDDMTEIIAKNYQRALDFSQEKFTKETLAIYQSL